IMDVLADPVVRAGISARPTATMVIFAIHAPPPLGIFVAHPRLNLVAGLIPEPTLLVPIAVAAETVGISSVAAIVGIGSLPAARTEKAPAGIVSSAHAQCTGNPDIGQMVGIGRT